MEWYIFDAAGTLLFKGAEPMEMGVNHHSSHIFPPPAQTITGALRTAVLMQNGISFEDYYKGVLPFEILAAIGETGKDAPFDVTGPLFHMDDRVFVPVPYSWFMDKSQKNKTKKKVFTAEPIHSPLVKTEDNNLFWVVGGNGEMVSLGGSWIAIEDLYAKSREKEIFTPDFFFTTEPRTGIALNRNRSVREGHLYTFTHIRLKPGVGMIFGTDKPLPISDDGLLKLGAEQRFGRYEKIKAPVFEKKESGTYLSLTLVEGTDQANRAVIATGKIQHIGGWDLKKGFHKPMKGYFPVGSVFTEKIESHFVQI